MYKTLLGSAFVSVLMLAGVQVAQADAPTMVFNYDPIQQVMTVSLSDGSSFNNIFGIDQLGSGVSSFNGTTSISTEPGTFGDAVGSEWLISNDFIATQNPPCDIPVYTGDVVADFADCIAAIVADGGTYVLGQYGITVPDGGPLTNPAVYVGDGTAPASSDTTTALTDTQVQAAASTATFAGTGRMTKNGFLVYKGTTFPTNTAPSVSSVDGHILSTLIKNKIVVKIGGVYVMRQNYTFASPSQPAAFVLNNLVNGWAKWKTVKGIPLGFIYKH